ncbi:MAG: prolyl oligopeptidase family serine peptidase [Clostridia bacterium]|nr:prolyl oligopeptidase family serine peptidase [Clostridia bacterium]
MEKIEIIEFNGYTATVIIPERPNGKWIWKTEFLYAFDQAERALLELGYTRVYYQISDKYGSPSAMKLMKEFYHFVVKNFHLDKKCVLFGFSRGGLYAFNFAIAYPAFVDKVYLDAPVLDLKTWPPKGSLEQNQMFEEYGLNADSLATFKGNPIDKLDEFFALNIPLLIIAGGKDEVVPFDKNAGRLIDYCREKDIRITAIIKADGLHHPHSLDDVQPILDFVN